MNRGNNHRRMESDLLLGFHNTYVAERKKTNVLHSSGGRESIFSSIGITEKRSHNCDEKEADAAQQKKKKERYKVHRVSYSPRNHVQILFRTYGSAFPQVLPFCILNVIWTVIINVLKEQYAIDLTFHSVVGHSFMGLLVSFLVVSRSKISYDRFMELRRHLAVTYKACREIAQLTTAYTMYVQTPKARAWREEVCFRTILLLRVTMDALSWSSTERDHWEDEYFDKSTDSWEQVSDEFLLFQSLHHGRRSNIDMNFRAPISFSHVLRCTMMRHPEFLGYTMPVNEYRDLVLLVGTVLDAFHGFRILTFTPYPFPLVQMTRAFLFFWVYSLPLVLLREFNSLGDTLLIVSLVTFGFIGVEYVSMALDDPFADETNDIDEHGMALLVYEDIYLALSRVDGPMAAKELHRRVIDQYKQGRALDCYREDLEGTEFWDPWAQPCMPNESTQSQQQQQTNNINNDGSHSSGITTNGETYSTNC